MYRFFSFLLIILFLLGTGCQAWRSENYVDSTDLKITMVSTDGFVMEDVLILLTCDGPRLDLDGKISNVKGEVTFRVPYNNSCRIRGGLHGYTRAEKKVKIGTQKSFAVILKQNIQFDEYQRHLEQPE